MSTITLSATEKSAMSIVILYYTVMRKVSRFKSRELCCNNRTFTQNGPNDAYSHKDVPFPEKLPHFMPPVL